MKKRGILFTWLVAKSVIIGFVFLLLSVNYLFGMFGDFGVDFSKPLPVVRAQIDKLGDINKRDPEGRTILMTASIPGDTKKNVQIIQYIIKKGGIVNLRANNPIGDTALHFAAYNGNVNIVRELLKNYANPLLFNKNGIAPFHIFTEMIPVRENLQKWDEKFEKFKKILNDFLVWGANINFRDRRKSFKEIDKEKGKYKLEEKPKKIKKSKKFKKAFKKKKLKTGMPILFWAIDFAPAKLKMFEFLQERYPQFIDFEMKVGGQTLKAFAKEKLENDFDESLIKPAILPVLWSGEMGPNNFDKRYSLNKNFTVTQTAVIKGITTEKKGVTVVIKKKENFLKTLVSKGANLNLSDKEYGNPSLFWALIYNKPKMVNFVLKNNGKAGKANKVGRYPIHYLYGILGPKARKEVVKTLFKYGADFNAQDKEGNTFLHRAVLLRDLDMIRFATSDEFLKDKLKFYLKNKKNQTVFDIAKKNKAKKTKDILGQEIKKLLRPLKKAKKPRRKKKGYKLTPLMKAAKSGDLDEIKKILKKDKKKAKTIINQENKGKETALLFAIRFRHSKVAEFLIKAGAKVNIQSKDKEAPLLQVVNIEDPKQQIKIANMLIEKGASVSTRNKNGDTIIHLAVEKKQFKLAEFLLRSIGTLEKNKKGKTPLDLAKGLKGIDKKLKKKFIDLLSRKKKKA